MSQKECVKDMLFFKDYYNYSKDFKTFFPKLNVKDINNIDYKKNNKLKIGFVSPDFVVNHSVTYFVMNTIKIRVI